MSFERRVEEAVPAGRGGPLVDTYVFRRKPPVGGPPRGRIIVVHGLGDAPVTWFPTLRGAFPEHELLLPALPGAGRGPLPKGLDHLTHAATVEWLTAIVHRLTADDLPTTLIGHSLGGWLTARALLVDSSLADRVGAPVLVNNAGTWYPDVERERRLLSPRRLEDVDELLDHIYATTPDLPVEALQALLDTTRSPGYRGLLLSTSEQDFLKPADIARLPPSTGVVWGVADRLVPPVAFETLRKSLRAPRVVTLDGVGHAPHIEASGRLLAALEGLVEG